VGQRDQSTRLRNLGVRSSNLLRSLRPESSKGESNENGCVSSQNRLIHPSRPQRRRGGCFVRAELSQRRHTMSHPPPPPRARSKTLSRASSSSRSARQPSHPADCNPHRDHFSGMAVPYQWNRWSHHDVSDAGGAWFLVVSRLRDSCDCRRRDAGRSAGQRKTPRSGQERGRSPLISATN
jgi:hypothetical protein